MSRWTSSSAREGTSGFTLIEVLVALAVIAVSLSAIGSLVAVTIRGASSVAGRVALIENARSIVTALPERDQLEQGSVSGASGDYRWRIDVLPFDAGVTNAEKSRWVPQTVVVRVQASVLLLVYPIPGKE